MRIDLRGEHILNSKSEYCRCRIRIPRLVIDQEEWKTFKKKEVQELETVRVQEVLEVDEEGIETAEMLEEEKQLARMETKEVKRKQKDGNKPPAKRKKMENLVDWGMIEEVGEKPEHEEIRNWLMTTEMGLSNQKG